LDQSIPRAADGKMYVWGLNSLRENREGNSRSLHYAPPDFLLRVVALRKSMRLSGKKHSIRENQ
jgi:hypothetical protein